MRYKDAVEQFGYLRQGSEQGKLELIYPGLDVLGSTPWRINKDIFEVVLRAWNSGERFLKIPPAVYEQQEPVPPPDYESDPRAKSTHMQRMKDWTYAKANCHSERCSVNYKLEIARAVCCNRVNCHWIRQDLMLLCSSSVRQSIFRITWISEAEHIPCRPISIILETISVEVCSSLENRDP